MLTDLRDVRLAVDATHLVGVIHTSRPLQAHQHAALAQWRLAVERARYDAERAERRYRLVEPEHRLVARGLETEWEARLRDLSTAEDGSGWTAWSAPSAPGCSIIEWSKNRQCSARTHATL